MKSKIKSKKESECFAEIIYYRFADSELEPGEYKKVTAHLGTCSKCKKFVEKIKEENLAIKEIFASGTPVPDLAPVITNRLNKKEFTRLSRRRLAYAATFFLVVFLFVFLFINRQDQTREQEQQVLVHSARVEGQAARPHIFESKDPGVKFIWLEKSADTKQKMEGTNEKII